jgi:hypothetical protein
MLELHPCKIARRGKAARGTIDVTTFGIPVTGDDGVTREWDYTPFADVDTAELIVFLQQFGNVNIALVTMFDNWRKSETLKNQTASILLEAQLVAENLVRDNEKAADIAKALLNSVKANITLLGEDNPMNIEWMLQKRRSVIDKERKKAGMQPRLVKKPEITPADLTDSE